MTKNLLKEANKKAKKMNKVYYSGDRKLIAIVAILAIITFLTIIFGE